MGFIINPYQVQPSGPSYGTLTTAWITATGETDTTILSALNTLESDLTTYGLTSKIKALYPFVGGTATKHKYNFMNTANFQITFNGGWTHSSNGSTPNGINAYGETGFNPSANLTDFNSHISYYSRTNVNEASCDFGNNALTPRINMFLYNSGFYSDQYNDSTTRIAVTSGVNTSGHFIGSRTTSTVHKGYKNGSVIGTNTNTETALMSTNTHTMKVGSIVYPGLYGTKQVALASIGDGLTDTEAANFYTAVQAFQTTLSRNV